MITNCFCHFLFAVAGWCRPAVPCWTRKVPHLRRPQKEAACFSQDNRPAVCHFCHQQQSTVGSRGKRFTQCCVKTCLVGIWALIDENMYSTFKQLEMSSWRLWVRVSGGPSWPMSWRCRILEQPLQVQTLGHRVLFGCRDGWGVCQHPQFFFCFYQPHDARWWVWMHWTFLISSI